MKCSSCGSEDTQRLEVIYESGTNRITTTSHTVGIGAAGGRIGIGSANTTTSGVSQSNLAKKAAPPPRKGYGKSIASVFGGIILFIIVGGRANSSAGLIVSLGDWEKNPRLQAKTLVCLRHGAL